MFRTVINYLITVRIRALFLLKKEEKNRQDNIIQDYSLQSRILKSHGYLQAQTLTQIGTKGTLALKLAISTPKIGTKFYRLTHLH